MATRKFSRSESASQGRAPQQAPIPKARTLPGGAAASSQAAGRRPSTGAAEAGGASASSQAAARRPSTGATGGAAGARTLSGGAAENGTPDLTAIRQDVEKAFKKIDKDGNGQLSRAEFSEFMKGLGMKDRQCTKLFAAVDVDGSGTIDFNEFVNWVMGTGATAAITAATGLSSSSASVGKQLRGQPQTGGKQPQTGGKQLRGHPLLGLSAAHVAGALLGKVAAAEQPREATVADIEPTVIRPQGKGVACPRDSRPGAAYVDSVGEDPSDVGISNLMLSYSWGYSVGDIADTLVSHCEDRGADPAKTYIWICCLCINQHRVKEAQAAGDVVPFDEFRDAFKERVEGIGHILAMMAPWHAPRYITRVWCDFELYTAMNSDKKVTIAMPPHSTKAMLEAIGQNGGDFNKMWQVLGSLDVEQAQASMPEDKERILGMIKNNPGFSDFNFAVAKFLQDWIVSTSVGYLSRHLRDRDLEWKELARSCDRIGQLLTKVGQPARALEVYSDSVKILRDAGAGPEWMSVALFNRAGAKMTLGDLGSAKEDYDEAERLDGQPGGISEKPWRARMSVGLCKMQESDFKSALAVFAEAKGSMEEETDESLQASSLMQVHMNIGNAKAALEDFEGANAAYASAEAECKRAGLSKTPEEARLLQNIGSCRSRTGDAAGSVEAYVAARQILARLGLLESSNGADVLMNTAISAWNAQDAEQALESAERAQSIFARLDLATTKNAQMASQIVNMARQMLGRSGPQE